MNNRFQKRLNFPPDKNHLIYSLISKIEELKGQWKMGTNLSPQTLGRLKKTVIVTSSGASTRIEGAVLSDEEVRKLLGGLKVKKLTTRDQQEVAGYAELLENVFSAHNNLKFSENTIKHFHKELLKYSDKDVKHRGKYKTSSNRVEAKDTTGKIVGVLFDPTPPYLVAKEMQELVASSVTMLQADTIHPLLIAANIIFEFLAIHPFQDGNGRISRILTNLLLLQAGYEYIPYISHEKLVEDNKEQYYLALNQTQRTWKTRQEDITPWLEFFLTICYEQAKRAHALMTEESMEVLLSEKQLLVWNYLVDHDIVTPKELRETLKIPTPTILQALTKLIGMKKVERLGQGRATRYRVNR